MATRELTALEAALRGRRDGGGKAFVPYVTGGSPGVDAGLLRALAEAGADADRGRDPVLGPGDGRRGDPGGLAAGARGRGHPDVGPRHRARGRARRAGRRDDLPQPGPASWVRAVPAQRRPAPASRVSSCRTCPSTRATSGWRRAAGPGSRRCSWRRPVRSAERLRAIGSAGRRLRLLRGDLRCDGGAGQTRRHGRGARRPPCVRSPGCRCSSGLGSALRVRPERPVRSRTA